MDALSNSPLIFISHDTRDANLAEAFSKLLSSVSAGVLKSFRSSDRKGSEGIEYGVEWYPELMSKLESASDVVCLLTQYSLDRPWILYEAGVAKGKLNTPVYGIALGIPLSRANSGPFAQFQNSDDNPESLTKLVIQLVRRIPGAEPDHDAILMQVHTFKERVSKALENMGSEFGNAGEGSGTDTSVAKMFEEVKVMFQDLPSRIERSMDRPYRSRRGRRFHPMMIHELSMMSSDGPEDPVGILVAISFLREDFPWLHELGLEAYRAAKSRNAKAAEEALLRFRRASEVALRGPFRDELGLDSKDAQMMIRDLPIILDEITERQLRACRPSAPTLVGTQVNDSRPEPAEEDTA